jgi:RimK family alpha-L-glutamate ligase
MRITLLTTLPSLIENKRLKEEAANLGHSLDVFDLGTFRFYIDEEKIDLNGLEKINSDLVIVRGVFNNIKPISTVIDTIRNRGIKVFDNNFVKHKYSIDKVSDLLKLALSGISIPKTFYARDFSEYDSAAEKIGFPVVIKSTRAGKGYSVFKIDSKEDLSVFIDGLKNEGKEAKSYLMQEFVDYEHDLRCLVIGEDVFCMKRIPSEGEFRANFSLGGSVEPFEISQSDKDLAIKALNSIDMSVGGVDILIGKNGLRYILEVNHTAGFVGMEKATGKNIAKIWLENAIANAK